MKYRNLALTLLLTAAMFIGGFSSAKAGGGAEGEFNISEMIFHHILDAHEWHIATMKNDDGTEKHISIPLPVILYTDSGIDFFMSSAFHHGEKKTFGTQTGFVHGKYMLFHEHIYYADGFSVNEKGEVTAVAPLDFSITKNVASLFISAFLLIFIFSSVSGAYKKRQGQAPKGMQSMFEPLIVFVRDEIVRPNIGEKHYKKYLPYILTLFFFIWINNLLGLMPTGANLTGNISFTFTMAILTLILTLLSSNGHYWKHIFAMPGVPVPILLILTPVEIIGIFTKPFALMMRLFANIMAGHTIILSLIGIIFIFKSVAVGIPVTIFVFMMFLLELFVAALQAFIFSLLTSLFIGQAMEEGHHEEEHGHAEAHH
jgi:F-type H+-transporting ATPase subunit a